jgi:MFS family permease
MKVPGGWGAIKRSFAIRDYRLFIIGNLSSNFGLWTQRVALGWLTWELTHSTAWLGGIALAETAPTFVFALIAGTMVDRVDYFRLMRITQSLTLSYSVIVAVLILGGWINIWILLTLVLLRGTATAFNRPSRMTAIFALVGRELLTSAVTINSIIFNTSRFVGPALGGVLIVTIGVGWTFAAAAAMFLVFTIMLQLIKATVPAPPVREKKSMLIETAEGLNYMFANPGLKVMVLALVGVGLVAKPLTDLLPGFVGEVFNRGPEGLALLMIAHGGGAMLGAAWMASWGSGIKGLTRVSIIAVAAGSFPIFLFAMAPVFWMSLPLIFLVGFAFILQSISNQTLLQSAADPTMRGRVISNYSLAHQGAPAIGALLIGGIAEQIGLRIPVAVGAASCLILWCWLWRQRHWLARALEVEGGIPAKAGRR